MILASKAHNTHEIHAIMLIALQLIIYLLHIFFSKTIWWDGTNLFIYLLFFFIFANLHEIGLAYFIAKSYPCLIKEKDQDSMTALQYLACNPNAFEMERIEGRQDFIEDMRNSKQQYGLIEIINKKIELHRNSGMVHLFNY